MAEGRVGLDIAIGDFVVAEDRSLAARVERGRRQARWRILRLQVHGRRMSRGMKGSLAGLRDAFVLFGLILRYAWSRPSPSGDVEPARVTRSRRALVILFLAFSGLALALFLPEREQDGRSNDPIIATAEASPAPAEPEPASLEMRRGPEVALPPEQRPWQPVRQPMALYHLESPELAGLSLVYRVSQRDRSRQDTLIWSARNEAGTEARRSAALLVVERHEGAAPTEKPLFADLAARAAEHRLVIERMARPQDIRTKFGPMEAADVTLRQESGLLPCLAFRRIDMAGITVVGWLCGSAQRPVDRVAMSCFLDRLDLVGGGRDTTLRKFFAEAERSRQSCTSARQPGRKLTWMDHEAPIPGLKLSARR